MDFATKLLEGRTARGLSVRALSEEPLIVAVNEATERANKAAPPKMRAPILDQSRLTNLEKGRSTSLTRAECTALEETLGVDRDSLWVLLLEDERKVDPEVRRYYEDRIGILGDLMAQQATDLTWVRTSDGMAFAVPRDAVARFIAGLEFAAPDIDLVLDGLGAAIADYREIGFEGGDLLHSLNRFLALPTHHRQMRLAAFAAELAASASAYVPQGTRTMRQAVANGDLPGGPDALQTFMRHVAAGGAAVARDTAAARLHDARAATAHARSRLVEAQLALESMDSQVAACAESLRLVRERSDDGRDEAVARCEEQLAAQRAMRLYMVHTVQDEKARLERMRQQLREAEAEHARAAGYAWGMGALPATDPGE